MKPVVNIQEPIGKVVGRRAIRAAGYDRRTMDVDAPSSEWERRTIND